METNRTLEILRTYNYAQKNHWQLMCDLSNNDYDISYFGGKVTIADNFVTFLRGVEDEFYLQEVVEYLYNELKDVNNDLNYNINNANYKGAAEELKFLLRYCYQEYTKEICYL